MRADMGFASIGRFVVAVVASAAFAACGNDRDGDASNDGGTGASGSEIRVCTRCGACTETVAITSAHHVDGPIDYPDPPPAGGDHNPCWAPWGVHTTAVPAERWVHNLEHGGVVVLYDCPDSCPSDQGALSRIAAFVAGHDFALMTPYTGMTKKFAVVSWGHRIVSDCVDEEAFAAFYVLHVNRAAESIPQDPTCS